MSQWRERHVQNWAYDGHTENVRQCLVHSRRDAFELASPDGGIPKTALHQVAESATSGPLMRDINFDRLCDTLDLLVEYGGPEACRVVDDFHETTALHWTAYGGGSKGAAYVARKMLECGVDVNSTSNEGATALESGQDAAGVDDGFADAGCGAGAGCLVEPRPPTSTGICGCFCSMRLPSDRPDPLQTPHSGGEDVESG